MEAQKRQEPPEAVDSDVRVEISADADCPRITVSDDGPGIDHDEIAVLEAGSETPLRHGSGIGLWLVKWVVDRSSADLSFDAGPGGTDVTIRFQQSAVAESQSD